MHQGCPLAYEPLAHAMERLNVLLIDVLGRHKAHGRTRHRFRDGLGIAAVVFMRLDVRLDELRCRSEEHTSELQSRLHLVCRLLLEKKKKKQQRELQKRNVDEGWCF